MLRVENTEVYGWEAAIRGMRNPMNSWAKSDSKLGKVCGKCQRNGSLADDVFCVGKNDHELMMRLVKAGTEHAKFMRMITVTADIIAPDYWFKEFSTYRVGVTENSTSTMHRIHAKEFTLEDFSHEHLSNIYFCMMEKLITQLNGAREEYLETKDKQDWWQMIQLLPMSYNYRRTVCMNYAVLRNMYHQRKNHKLDEWHGFCDWVKSLPFSELITEV